MSTKHTQGPWSLDGRTVYVNRDIAHVKNAPHMMLTVSSGIACTPEEAEANARLIAAAPELLEALFDLVGNIDPESENRLFDAARAAIDKATGGAV